MPVALIASSHRRLLASVPAALAWMALTVTGAWQVGTNPAEVRDQLETAAPGEASGAAVGRALPAVATQPAVLPSRHRVQPSETLSAIAQRYGLDTAQLRRSNAIADPRALMPGQVLVLPDPDAPRPLTPAAATGAGLPVESVLDEVAREFGWRPATVKAVAWVESRWDQQVVSPRGAIGVMQVRPATGARVGAHLGRDLDLYDLRDNVTAGVAYLDLLLDRYDGDVYATLAAYHQGPTSLRDTGVLGVSERYVTQVLALRERFAR